MYKIDVIWNKMDGVTIKNFETERKQNFRIIDNTKLKIAFVQ